MFEHGALGSSAADMPDVLIKFRWWVLTIWYITEHGICARNELSFPETEDGEKKKSKAAEKCMEEAMALFKK